MNESEFSKILKPLRHQRPLEVRNRIELIDQCICDLAQTYDVWNQLACEAKRIEVNSKQSAEELTAGPVATMRFLQLIKRTLQNIQEFGAPDIPGKVIVADGRCRVPVFPTRWLFDSILFSPIQATTWLNADVNPENVSQQTLKSWFGNDRRSEVVLVLGAGNVSSIAATDALSKILLEGHSVCLKMNPVNDYLQPVFESAFQSLIEANRLRVVSGGAEIGNELVGNELVSQIHITGSISTHDKIVWGDSTAKKQVVMNKTITSELGNVSPWAIVPGNYSPRQLHSQVESIAASITNNASFNCIATKIIMTAKDWPQRSEFFRLLDQSLKQTERRYAYYPGASERFERFSNSSDFDREYPPWTIRRDVDFVREPHMLMEESFTCVVAEYAVDSHSPIDFMNRTVEIMNGQLWGTLAATFTIPAQFEQEYAHDINHCFQRLRYGTIGVNLWPALSFAFMSPPWGGHPSSTLQDAQSGIGYVHNTYLLDQPETTVIRAPLSFAPKPIWFSKHRHPQRVARDVFHLYRQPSWLKMPRVAWNAFTG